MATYNSLDKLIEEIRLWVKNNPEEFNKIVDNWVNDRSKEILHKDVGGGWAGNPSNSTLCGKFNQDCARESEIISCEECLEIMESNNYSLTTKQLTTKQKIIHSYDKQICSGEDCYCHLMK